jgi:hypothetical protein
MTRFVVGDDRSQSTLFPERLDDYVRLILAGITAHVIGAPIARVFTQPGPKADVRTAPNS